MQLCLPGFHSMTGEDIARMRSRLAALRLDVSNHGRSLASSTGLATLPRASSRPCGCRLGSIDRQGRRRASWRNGPRQTRTLLASACLTIHWVACAAAGDDLGAHRADRRVELTRASPCSDFRLLT